ncbi:hypothetical protein H2509_10095 [Stappia sp. F7233]|uniref:Uncharacterized protein n=1 Tax=Stappia albiluteola TaxID=2758565 RepID=A0A839AEA8_9HYPH|nr:hypothetical protein [Stappia albiluteola]MBA5776136.1 hypothetical protein [Stappia albiluteola]MBA5777104.1 hypothetical protein [Stappia albiluteola]MBA5777436.1 hypothetical protein [Stappia albiluteola]MBA5777475.1 hypothetical protein [Stappia albiluteola]
MSLQEIIAIAGGAALGGFLGLLTGLWIVRRNPAFSQAAKTKSSCPICTGREGTVVHVPMRRR